MQLYSENDKAFLLIHFKLELWNRLASITNSQLCLEWFQILRSQALFTAPWEDQSHLRK